MLISCAFINREKLSVLTMHAIEPIGNPYSSLSQSKTIVAIVEVAFLDEILFIITDNRRHALTQSLRDVETDS